MFRRKMQHFGPNIVGPAASGKFPVVRCRGADSRARRSTNDLYQLPLKWKKLSTCHCEGALRPWQSREGTCSLYKLLLKRCAPIASVAALSERHAGQQHVAYGFCGVTPPELSLRGRFAPVAISGRHLQSVPAAVKMACTDCVCSGGHCAAVGGSAALRMRRALYG